MSRQNKPRTSCIWCGKSDHVRKSSKKCEFYNGKTSAIPTEVKEKNNMLPTHEDNTNLIQSIPNTICSIAMSQGNEVNIQGNFIENKELNFTNYSINNLVETKIDNSNINVTDALNTHTVEAESIQPTTPSKITQYDGPKIENSNGMETEISYYSLPPIDE